MNASKSITQTDGMKMPPSAQMGQFPHTCRCDDEAELNVPFPASSPQVPERVCFPPQSFAEDRKFEWERGVIERGSGGSLRMKVGNETNATILSLSRRTFPRALLGSR